MIPPTETRPMKYTPREQAIFNTGYMTAIEKFDSVRLNPVAFRACVNELGHLVTILETGGTFTPDQSYLERLKQVLALATQDGRA